MQEINAKVFLLIIPQLEFSMPQPNQPINMGVYYDFVNLNFTPKQSNNIITNQKLDLSNVVPIEPNETLKITPLANMLTIMGQIYSMETLVEFRIKNPVNKVIMIDLEFLIA